jgi:hypothetical protein
VDSNKTRKTSPNGYGQASSWRRLPTIDTDQYVALVVGNNILKFHQDRTTNETPISDGSGCEKKTLFFSLSLLQTAASLSFPCFFISSVFPSFLFCSNLLPFIISFFSFFFFLVCCLLCTKVHVMVGPSHRREHPPNKSPPPDYVGGSTNPAAILQISSFCIGNDFVIISEPLSSVWIFSICINLSSSASRIQ